MLLTTCFFVVYAQVMSALSCVSGRFMPSLATVFPRGDMKVYLRGKLIVCSSGSLHAGKMVHFTATYTWSEL